MNRIFWVDGRLPWPLVFAVAFVSALLLVTDFAWRVLVISFGALLVSAILIGGIVAVLLFVAHLRLRRRRPHLTASRGS
jgi:amino acid transporter